VGFAPLSNGRTSLSFPLHRPRSVVCRSPLLGFVRVLPRFPFIDLIPGVRLPAVFPPLRTRAASSNRVPTSSFRTTSSVYSADSPGFTPGFSSPFTVAKDLRACCIPLPIVGFDAFLSADSGGASPEHPVLADMVPCWSLGARLPRIEVHTPRRIPPARSSLAFPPGLVRVAASLASSDFTFPAISTFPMRPFPASSLLPYRWDVVPRGVAP